jgi:hypothetical protein
MGDPLFDKKSVKIRADLCPIKRSSSCADELEVVSKPQIRFKGKAPA